MTPIAEVSIRTARAQFGDDVPALIRTEILHLWPRLEWLLPRWVRTVTFHWKASADNDESAECDPDYTYGYVGINVTGLWLDDRERIKLHDLVHEVLHLWMEPVAGYAKKTFKTLLKEEAPKFHKTVEQELDHRVEVAIQDMAEVLTARFLQMDSE